ncbi:MAG: glutathione S-transferase N-terminal domain-containing protein [Gammaproteobacteria bacterium]|nr:glutathione S-transferase N-terminal domain-containing protein [Gammaproteobacteria bacterium]
MILYSEANTLGSHRVRLLLAEKNLSTEIILVDPDDVPEDLIHLNPYTSLPTLVDRDLVLYDAKVISDYIDERYPHPPMLPVEPVSRGKSRLALYRMEKDWYSLLPELSGTGATAEQARKMLTDSMIASAEVFRLKPFFLSDEYSLLDVSLAPFIWRFPQMGITLPAEAQPVLDYAQRLFARSGFQASLTDAEKDEPRQ